MIEIFEYRQAPVLALSPQESLQLLSCVDGEVTVGLGLFRAKCVKTISDFVISLEGVAYNVAAEVLEEHSSRRSVLLVEPGGAYYEAEVRSNNYYKLVPVEGSAPTLEINGIHMHRVKGVTPLEDARAKVRALGVMRGQRVLEIGTGLGYTTISSLESGASLIITIEVDENVLWLAERNPWSRGLSSEKVRLIHGDAAEIVGQLADERFDIILHDPPRLTASSGPLYSTSFYQELYRVLRPGGRLFHYTGEPGRAKGASFPSRVASRLKEAGFEDVRYVPKVMGIVARKPTRVST